MVRRWRTGNSILKKSFFLQRLFKIVASVILVLLFLIATGFSFRSFLANYSFNKARYYFNDGAYNLLFAEKWYKVGEFFDPNSREVHYQLARIFFLEGKFGIAREMIEEELRRFSDFKRSYYVLGLINGYDGNFPEAITDFEEFLKWKPSSWAAQNDLAWVYFQVGDFEKVLLLADSGLKESLENPWLLNTKGLALHNLDRKEEAKEYFERATKEAEKLKPEDWGAAYPGNNSAFYAQGLAQMLSTIKSNKDLSF